MGDKQVTHHLEVNLKDTLIGYAIRNVIKDVNTSTAEAKKSWEDSSWKKTKGQMMLEKVCSLFFQTMFKVFLNGYTQLRGQTELILTSRKLANHGMKRL